MVVWPPSLIDKIARRNVVILIGSGVSANSVTDDNARPPTWYDFLLKAKAELDHCPAHVTRAINQYNYLEACDYLRTLHGEAWIQIVRDAFQTPHYRPAVIHRHIFELDSRIVCSLNFDRIFDTFAISESQGTYIIKNYWDEDIGSISSGPDRYLLKMHGSIDAADRLIFSASDYAAARNKYTSFYSMLDALLITQSFLILGCGLHDPDIRLMFENYRYKYNLKNHFMAVPKPISRMEIDLIKDSRGINIIPYSAQNGHRELTESLGNLVELVAARREQIASSQSW